MAALNTPAPYIKTVLQIYIQTNRNKDVKTYMDKQTNRQTDRRCKSTRSQADRCTERQMFTHTFLQYIRQTYIQTDRQDRQTRKTNRPIDRRTESICVLCKKSGQNLQN